jgi:hypothetical protein
MPASIVARSQDLDDIIKLWEKTTRIGRRNEALRDSVAQRISYKCS